MGPNLRPLPSAPDAAPWMPNINPPDYNWDARWLDIDVSALRSLMDERRDMDVEYDRPDLSKEALGDPYQRLFQDIVLKHVDYVLQHLDDPAPIKPLRLLLLGTAGTGKTTCIQTLLQELKRCMRRSKYEGTFVRVAAYTGCAAYNVRYGASTLHRLFDMRNPFKWQELPESSERLQRFQEKMRTTRLLIFDEVSMIGRQIMGKISSRCSQATPAHENPLEDPLGNKSCIAVGDPAQCPPIRDDVHYDDTPHKDTHGNPDATRLRMSN